MRHFYFIKILILPPSQNQTYIKCIYIYKLHTHTRTHTHHLYDYYYYMYIYICSCCTSTELAKKDIELIVATCRSIKVTEGVRAKPPYTGAHKKTTTLNRTNSSNLRAPTWSNILEPFSTQSIDTQLSLQFVDKWYNGGNAKIIDWKMKRPR